MDNSNILSFWLNTTLTEEAKQIATTLISDEVERQKREGFFYIEIPDSILNTLKDIDPSYNPPSSSDFLATQVRLVRSKLLTETDWWVMPDRTPTQAQLDYRQALRDITAQEGFPNDVTWPTKPE